MTRTLITARALRAQGIGSIPCRAGDKRPTCKWADYQVRLPEDSELAQFFSNGASLAIVAGLAQCIDVDCKNAPDGEGLWERFRQEAAEHDLAGLLSKLVIQRTPSGGYHVIFRCTAPLRNVKLAETPDRKTLIETRGHGGYFLASPSEGYTVIQGDLASIPEIDEEEREDLFVVARLLCQRPQTPRSQPAAEDMTPGRDYDARGDVAGLLRQHGWTSRDEKHWTRPGKTRGVSATLGAVEAFPRHFKVFSSNAHPFEPEEFLSPFGVFAVLEAGRNFAQAASLLRRQGYGSPRDRTRDHTALALPGAPADLEPGATQETAASLLPPIRLWEEIVAEPPPRPPEIIAGVLFAGAKGMIAGPSKSHKTFTLTALAFAVGAGRPWLGFPTLQSPVLYLNLELQEYSFWERGSKIAPAVLGEGIAMPHERLLVWTLRGFGVQLGMVRKQMLSVCKHHGVGLIIIDPTYKLNQGGEENAAEDVSALLNEFEMIARETGAAVVFAHHFAKGDASAKSSIDRASGSGVWARDPDAIIMFTPMKDAEEDVMSVEMHLRNFKPQPPFAVRWTYPAWERAPEIDVSAAPSKPGRPGAVTMARFETALKKVGGTVTRKNVAILAASLGCSERSVWAQWKLFQAMPEAAA